MCLISAELVVKRLRGDGSAGPLPEPLAGPAGGARVVSIVYLACLLVALGAMVLLDARFRLVFWRDARRATIVLALGLVFFLAWDAAGIALGVFARGGSRFMTGIVLAPEFPLEEVFFLLFLCYLTLVLLFGGRAVLDRRERRARARERRMTYALLSLVFLAVAVVVLAVALVLAPDRARLVRRWWAPALLAAVVVLVLTAVFDNLMIVAGFMTYADAHIAGAKLVLVPARRLRLPARRAACCSRPCGCSRAAGGRGRDRPWSRLRSGSWCSSRVRSAGSTPPSRSPPPICSRPAASTLTFVVGTLFFLIPYNLAMYGINDVFDYESDLRNPRKGGAEGALLDRSAHRRTLVAAVVTTVPFLVYLVVVGSPLSWLVLAF